MRMHLSVFDAHNVDDDGDGGGDDEHENEDNDGSRHDTQKIVFCGSAYM